jgi:allophanate hydrolase subunit 2
MGAAFAVPAGTVLTAPPPQAGVRSQLAVRAGISVPPVLGSRSSDRPGEKVRFRRVQSPLA